MSQSGAGASGRGADKDKDKSRVETTDGLVRETDWVDDGDTGRGIVG
jgi:hypothetical protein